MDFKNINAEEFAQLMKNEDHEIIDVRSPFELVEGSIPGAKMINMFDDDFQDKLDELDRSKTYLLYCRSGNRSMQACRLMSAMGFEKLYNLVGGIGAWNDLKPVL